MMGAIRAKVLIGMLPIILAAILVVTLIPWDVSLTITFSGKLSFDVGIYKVYASPDEVTYYFDEYSTSQWTDPSKIVDNDLETYASEATDGQYTRLAGTNGPGTDLGTITKVEIRCYGYGDGNDRIDIAWISDMSTEYQLTMPLSPDWSSYANVTADPNVDGWTWAKVASMVSLPYLQKDNVAKGNTIYCAKAELRVTYTVACTEDISNTPDSKDFGIVSVSLTYNTTINFFNVTNNSGGSIDVTVHATNMTGGVQWTLSDTATAGSDIYGLKVGLDDDDDNFDIIVKLNSPYNNLVAGLGDGNSQYWGLQLITPTSFSDEVEKQSTTTLTAVCQ